MIRAIAWSCAAVVLALVATTPLPLFAQVFFGATIFLVAVLANRVAGPRMTVYLVLLSLVTSSRYLFWRITSTAVAAAWTWDVVFGVLLLSAEIYAFVMLVFGYLQAMAVLPRKPAPLPPDTTSWPTVDVFVPTYNEPLAVVRTTILAAKAIDWPAEKLRVWVLDDGRRPQFRDFAASAGVGYLTRPDNRYAKAGNLNTALARTDGEYVAIFDSDHVPTRSFLQSCMGWFLHEPRLGLVQMPHHFYSPDPFERNLGTFRGVPNEGELFYGLIQKGNDLWDAAFFCGSCAVIRRAALEEVGGIAVETVTEDAHTALKMQRRGWSTAYLDIPQAAGLATESLSAHVGQRIRWARGMAQIFRTDNPFLGRGLRLMQRVCYGASMLHFFGGIPRLIFLSAPLCYLVFDLHIFNALPATVLAYALPHLAHSHLTNSRIQGGVRHSFWSEVYETCLSFYIAVPTTVALVAPRAGRFNVTAKGGRIDESYFDWRIVRPHLVLAAMNLVGLGVGVLRLWTGRGEVDVLGINIAWTLQNLIVLGAALAVAHEKRQRRERPRVEVSIPALLVAADGQGRFCNTMDLSLGGARLSLPPGMSTTAGDRVWVSLDSTCAGEEVPVPARVVSADASSARVRFESLSLEEETAVVRAIFSRANAWTRWAEGREADRPLRALASIGRRAVGGFAAAARAVRPAHVREPVNAPGLARSGS